MRGQWLDARRPDAVLYGNHYRDLTKGSRGWEHRKWTGPKEQELNVA